jgi:hypothetical protein
MSNHPCHVGHMIFNRQFWLGQHNDEILATFGGGPTREKAQRKSRIRGGDVVRLHRCYRMVFAVSARLGFFMDDTKTAQLAFGK